MRGLSAVSRWYGVSLGAASLALPSGIILHQVHRKAHSDRMYPRLSLVLPVRREGEEEEQDGERRGMRMREGRMLVSTSFR